MIRTNTAMRAQIRTSLYLAAMIFVMLAAASAVPAATFGGIGVGNIPDGAPGGSVCGDPGPPLDITFVVSGLTAPLSDVKVSMTGLHFFIGDLEATLIAPGDSASAVLFKNLGAATATACGDASFFAGPFDFFDSAPATPTFWQAAASTGSGGVPAGNYRSTAPLTGAVTTITPAFAGLTTGQINGSWTLRIRDGGQGTTGRIDFASMYLTAASETSPGPATVDFNGDGKTDFSIVRNTGGGPTGQLSWFNKLNGLTGVGSETGAQWGMVGDIYVPEDYDGDRKTDIAVWRPGTTAKWYILRSSDASVEAHDFGQTNDDPTMVGDYDGDGKADLAIYRSGLASGDPSSWWYRRSTVGGSGCSASGACNSIVWGKNGDFAAPGDYDGDGKNDFLVQRTQSSFEARFFILYATGAIETFQFGTPTDVMLPGDYDGDGRTDLTISRGTAGQIRWFIKRSSDGIIDKVDFGISATDFTTQGDYDGDGRTDPGVFRPSTTPGQSLFWYLGSSGGPRAVAWGQNLDYPVANYNRH